MRRGIIGLGQRGHTMYACGNKQGAVYESNSVQFLVIVLQQIQKSVRHDAHPLVARSHARSALLTPEA